MQQQLIIPYFDYQSAAIDQNTVSYSQAQERHEITVQENELERMKDTARYLYGSRRGCWGRQTTADQKRDIAIDKKRIQVQRLKGIYFKNYNIQL